MAESKSIQTASSVMMFAPNGERFAIPNAEMPAHMQAGGELALPVTNPQDGQTYWIRSSQLGEAQNQGGKVDWSKAPQEHHEGFWSAYGGELSNMAKGLAGGLVRTSPTVQMGIDAVRGFQGKQPESVDRIKQAIVSDKERASSGAGKVAFKDPAGFDHSDIGYRMIAPIAENLGINVPGMEKNAVEGNTKAILGQAAAPASVAIATPVIAKGVSAGVAKVAPIVSDAIANSSTKAVRAAVPEAANMHPKALFGAEKLFRAAAPVGSDPMFRKVLYTAAGDLAEVGEKIGQKMEASKGGALQPDMRVTVARDGINEHLSQMYNQERAPQIARHAQNPVVPKYGVDATNALEYLAKNAGVEADRALASKALSGETLNLSEADQLARLTNKELSPLRGMTPQELAQVEGTSKRMASLQSLDETLGKSIADELQNRGESGIQAYERRYAALSQFRDQLQTRINATELQRNLPGFRTVRHLMGGKSGIASASQAAIADVNVGKSLQAGFKSLVDSGIKAERPVAPPPRVVKGLLNEANPGNKLGPSGNLGPDLNNPPEGYPSYPPRTGAQGGHAGNGVASIEELTRPGKNFVINRSGGVTYHGKSFAPESTPAGGAHVTVLPNGEIRVNAGKLTEAQLFALKKALR